MRFSDNFLDILEGKEKEIQNFKMNPSAALPEDSSSTALVVSPGSLNSQDLSLLRAQSQNRLKLAWEDICSRYSHSFETESDEIDLATEEIIVDKGFMRTT